MATCKENCIHYSVCGIWDRRVFVDYEKDILSDFSDLPNVEKYCRNYFSKQIEAKWIEHKWTTEDDWGCFNHRSIECSACRTEIYKGESVNYCPNCGAKMVGKR